MPTAPGSDYEWNEPPSPIQFPRRRLRLVAPPRPFTPLFGRGAEVAAVSDLLTRDHVRLVTLVGPGGIGKTRLAQRVAAEVAEEFDDQVAWAPVATATTADSLMAALAQAVGVPESGGAPIFDSLKVAIHDARLLLAIDNFEQVLDAAPLLSDLLHACPRLSLLVTSRALLRIAGEHPIEVPPLATAPDPAGSATAAAVQLFAGQATSVYPAFELTPENAPVVAEICRRLDGLPLAIELAAARSRLLPPDELLARLDRRLPNLTAGQRDAPARHRTMRDAIAWSYDLLTPEEQSVFRSLSTFSGGCTLEAAEAVCRVSAAGDGGLPYPDAVTDTTEVIESLIAQSLVQVVPAAAGMPRLTMLETVHEFAAEHLTANGDDGPRRRHAAYFRDLAARVERGFLIGDYPKWSVLIGPERANLRAALEWALQHGDADTALQVISAMYSPNWTSDAYAQENERYLKRTLDLRGGSPAARAAALVIAAWVAPAHFDGTEAEELGEEALAIAQLTSDDFGVARANEALGVIKLHASDEDSARRFLSEALDGYRRASALTGAGWMLCDLAALDSRDAIDEGGDPESLDRARARYDEAVALFRAIEHPRGIARSLHGLAYVTYKQRDLPRALANMQEVLTLGWAQRWPVFSYLEDIGDIAGRIGQAETAARLYGAADAERATIGLPIEPQYRAEYERDVAVARQALGEAGFVAGWAAGQALTAEQAVAEALAVSIGPEEETTGTNETSPVSLSPRELEVMRLLATGLSDRAIAETLYIGERTVNTHVAHIFTKLGVRNRAAAVTAAVAAGLVDPDSASTGSAQAG